MLPKRNTPTTSKPLSTAAPTSANGGRNIKLFLNPVLPKTSVSLKLGLASYTFNEALPFRGKHLTVNMCRWDLIFV